MKFDSKSLMTKTELHNASVKSEVYKSKFADKSSEVNDTAYAILAAMAAMLA